jgi:hypothetical protein
MGTRERRSSVNYKGHKRAVLLFLALAYLAAAGLRLMQLTCREGAGRILS